MKLKKWLVILLVVGIMGFLVGDLMEASMYGYGDVITYELVTNFKDLKDYPHLLLKQAFMSNNPIVSKVALDFTLEIITIEPVISF